MKKQVSLTPVLAIALLIVALVGWFGLIGPKQSRSAHLDEEIAELESKVAAAVRPKPKSNPAQPEVEIEVADLFRLAKAMPDREDMPSMILELNSIALSTGVEFLAIQPTTPLERGAYHAVPVSLTFEGNYYDLTDFLFRLRNLVSVRDGVLAASGRLYTVDAIEFHEADGGFPEIKAVVTVSAYSYGAAPTDDAASTASTTPAQTETTQTETTQTTTATTTTETTQTTPAPPAAPPPGTAQASGGTG